MNTEKNVPAKAKILVLDDNPIIQRAVYFALRDHGYQVSMVGEVLDAIKMIRREQVDLVLVDLSFPLEAADIGGQPQDGFFFIDWIRRTPEISKPKIIIISSTDPAQYRERANAAEVKACLQKPLNKEALLAAVQSAFASDSTSAPPAST